MLPPVLPQNWRVPAGLQPSPVPDLNHQVCRSNFRQVAIRQGLHLIPLVMKNRDRDGRPGALTGACPPDLVRSRDAFFAMVFRLSLLAVALLTGSAQASTVKGCVIKHHTSCRHKDLGGTCATLIYAELT